MIHSTKVAAAAGEIARFGHVMDMTYNPFKTRLAKEAKAAGSSMRSDVGMFVQQGAEQTRLWTKIEPPTTLMRQAVLERLAENGGN